MEQKFDVDKFIGSFIENGSEKSIKHYGILGMKWGKRKADAPKARTAKASVRTYHDEGDFVYEKQNADSEKKEQSIKQITRKARSKLVSDPDYIDLIRKVSRGGATNADNKYYAAVEDLLRERINENLPVGLSSVVQVYNDHGILTVGDSESINLELDRQMKYRKIMQHSLEENSQVEFLVVTDNDGFITGFALPDATHSFLETHGDKELLHYGVLGMKWGRRKSRDGSYKSTEVVEAENRRRRQNESSVKPSSQKKGRGNSERNKMIKRSNTLRENRSNRQMSDAEMKRIIDRINLEKQFAQATATPASPRAENAVGKFLKENGMKIASNAVSDVGSEVAKYYLRKMATKYTGVNFEKAKKH